VEDTVVEKEPAPSVAQNTVESDQPQPDVGYGFFDDEPEQAFQGRQSLPSIEEQAYGFFADEPEIQLSATETGVTGKVIDLGAELNIRTVADCKARIQHAMNEDEDIKLDAANLQKIDTAGLQMLLSLRQSLKASSRSIQWQSFNELIDESAAMIGLPSLCVDDDSGKAFGFFSDTPRVDASEIQDDAGYGFF
jgi:ABC-type transporter Mla MlaB component